MKYQKIALISLVAVFSLALTLPLLTIPLMKAYLNVNVTVNPEYISPGQQVNIACWAEMAGKGMVFVIQPGVASSEAQCTSQNLQSNFNQTSSDPIVLHGKS